MVAVSIEADSHDHIYSVSNSVDRDVFVSDEFGWWLWLHRSILSSISFEFSSMMITIVKSWPTSLPKNSSSSNIEVAVRSWKKEWIPILIYLFTNMIDIILLVGIFSRRKMASIDERRKSKCYVKCPRIVRIRETKRLSSSCQIAVVVWIQLAIASLFIPNNFNEFLSVRWNDSNSMYEFYSWLLSSKLS